MADIMNGGYLAPARIKVIGVGGGGNNAVNRMVISELEGAAFAAVNTDRLVLDGSKADETIVIGEELTKGLGAGANPEIGAKAAEETKEEIKKLLVGVDMLFITAGMGGGTGTGAAPVIAQLAYEMNILTVGIVTKPFEFEGRKRMANALMGIEKMKDYVDTLLVIPNQKLLEAYPDLEQAEAYLKADEVLRNAVKGITQIITKPTMINLDFADVKTIMQGAGLAHMGIGEAYGPDDDIVITAVKNAVTSPLLETNISGAKGVIINYITPSTVKLRKIDEATRLVQEVVDENANIIFGQGFDDSMGDRVEVTIIATGFPDHINEQRISAMNAASQGKTGATQQAAPQQVAQQPVQEQAKPVEEQQPVAPSQNQTAFEREVATNPAFRNMSKAGHMYLTQVEAKVEIVKDPSVPAFIKGPAIEDLKKLGVDVTLLVK